MRVLMISKACLVGSYQRKLEELARLPDMELTVVVPPYWRDERGVIRLERAHTDGYELVVEPLVFNGHFHVHFYPRLARQFQRIQPDVVHIDEEPYNLATAQAMWLARKFEARPLFFTWQNILRRYPPPFSWIEQYNLRRAAFAIAGNADAVTVLRSKGYNGSARVIPQFGVDPELFSPGDAEKTGETFNVGYVGRLVMEKGVNDLLHALAGLSGPWQLSIVGSGPLRQSLETEARALNVEDRVSFEEQISSLQIPAHLRRLDVLVLPSRTRPNWKEQFGRVLVEAMSCGIAVIGSDCGEIPRVIGEAGLVFPEGDVEALRDCLARLRGDPALRAELGRRGRARVLAHYTQAQVAAQTYAVYREILGHIPMSKSQ
ncbi:MAG: glycosyltransferase family 4 protein [Anaerolineae bacterium]|nr:glycosyltransferase family 4 protein [Anaerolineae bacterium]MDH7474269.1 glycosyltransferase family 4 protein [Anaerolineae bacterium]